MKLFEFNEKYFHPYFVCNKENAEKVADVTDSQTQEMQEMKEMEETKKRHSDTPFFDSLAQHDLKMKSKVRSHSFDEESSNGNNF